MKSANAGPLTPSKGYNNTPQEDKNSHECNQTHQLNSNGKGMDVPNGAFDS